MYGLLRKVTDCTLVLLEYPQDIGTLARLVMAGPTECALPSFTST